MALVITALDAISAHYGADEATLDLIKFLERIAQVPAQVLLTYRDDELGRDHPLAAVLGDLPNIAVAHLRLTPLSEQAVAQLALQANQTQHAAQQIYAITGGTRSLSLRCWPVRPPRCPRRCAGQSWRASQERRGRCSNWCRSSRPASNAGCWNPRNVRKHLPGSTSRYAAFR